MNYIYLITNKINGKQYIGQTIRTIEERWKGHISASKHQKDNNYFHNAIQKYGESSFEISLLEEVKDASLLDEKEQYYISKYNTYFPNGYNTTIGGGGVQRHDYNRIKELWDLGYTSKEICELENIHQDTLRFILRGYKDYNQETARKRGIIHYRGCRIGQYTKDGKFIQTFSSIAEASRAMGVTDMAIGRAIKRNGTSCGFIWKKLN
mgnify:FL=1